MNAMSEIDEALSSGNLAYDIVTFPAVENIDSLSATNSVKRSRISSSLSKADDFHTNHIKKLTLFKWKNRNLRIKDKNELVLPEKEGHEMIIQRRVFFTWREIYGASRHNRTMTLRQSFSKFQSKMVYQLILKRYVMYVLKRRALCHLRQAFYGWQIKTTIDKESNINDLIARRHYLERKFRNVFLALQKNALANKQYRQYHDWCVQDMTKYRMYQCLIRWYTKRKSIQFYEHNTINTISTDFKIVTRLRNVCVDSLHQWRAVVLKKRRLQIAHIELIELIAQRLRCTAMKKWKKTFRHRIRDLRRYRVSVIQSHLILQKYMRKWCKVFQSKESNIENNFLMFRYIRKWRDWVITNRLKTNRSRSTQSSIAPFRNLPVVSIQSPKRRFDRCVNRSVDRSQYTVSRRVKEQHEPEVISDSTDQLMEVSQHFNRFVSLIQDRRNRRVLTDISINQHHLDRIRRKALDCLRKWRMTSALAHQYQLVTRVKNCVNITACWRAWMNYIKKQKAKRSLYQLARILHDKVIVINHIRSAFKRWLHRTRDNKKIARNTNNSIKCLQWTKLREFMLVLRARSKIAVMETQALTQVHRLSSCRRAMRWWRGWHGVRTLSNVLLLLADQQQKRFWFRLFFYNLRMRVHRLSNHPSTISVSESIRHVSFISAIPNDYNSTMSPVSINRKRYEPKSSSLSYKQVDHRSDDSIKSIDNKGNYDNKSVYSVGSSSQFTFQSMQSYASESVSQHSSLTPADSISLLRMRHNRSISKSASLDYTDRICNEADFFYEARLRAKRAWIFRLLRRKATQSRLLREVHQVASDHHK